ncbi:MAG: hypothetical protein RLZZ297_896 [Chloroflexota bacterium]
MPRTKPSIQTILWELARTTSESVPLPALIDAVHARRGVPQGGPSQRIRALLLKDPVQCGWVETAPGVYVPLRIVTRGVSFRIIPDSQAIRDEYFALEWLSPYINPHQPVRTGHDLHVLPVRDHGRLGLMGWMRANAARPGDHIVVTLDSHHENVIHLLLDRAEDQHLEDTEGAEQQLRDAYAALPPRQRTDAGYSNTLLALLATATWRNAYPPRPWTIIRDAVVRGGARADATTAGLRGEITTLQQLLRLRRQADADRGLWNGIAPRYSAVRLAIDPDTDDEYHGRVAVPPIDTRTDHTARIDESLGRGLYDVQINDDDDDTDDAISEHTATGQHDDDGYTDALRSDYSEDDADDDDDDDGFGDEITGEDLDDDTFAMLFANRHPALEQWSSQLLKSMLPHERRMLVRAESDDEYNNVLTVALQRTIPRNPAFLQTLRVTQALPTLDPTDGGQTYAAFQLAEYASAQSVELADDVTPQHDDDVFATGGEALFAVETALRASEQLIKRYGQSLEAEGLRQTTIKRKLQYLYGLSQFIARYYTQSLDAMTYAMYDEYVYFYYPRHASAIAPRNANDLLRTVRDFFSTTVPSVAPIAQALYESRQQAETLLRLLVRTHQYPHEMTALVVHLFAPYTA